MRAQDETPPVAIESRPDTVVALDVDLRGHLRQGTLEHEASLRDRHAEVLEGSPGDPPPRGRGKAGEGLGQVREGEAAPAPEDRIAEVPEAPSEPCGDRKRKGRNRCSDER
jgi:hypothetical protein